VTAVVTESVIPKDIVIVMKITVGSCVRDLDTAAQLTLDLLIIKVRAQLPPFFSCWTKIYRVYFFVDRIY